MRKELKDKRGIVQIRTEVTPVVQDKGNAHSWRKRVASSGGGITFFH
jgi:hypothetical protein